MAGPIRPEDVQKDIHIPDAVFTVFNALISARFDGTSATVNQNDAINRITDTMSVTRSQIFERHWLDVEESYRNAGWVVVYEKPAYNESGEATFTFTRKK